ncbi:MAG: YceD family protein [Gammaproteobacteria bacterium]
MPLALTDLLSPDAPVQGELRVSVPIRDWPRVAALVAEAAAGEDPGGAIGVDVSVAPLAGAAGVVTVTGRVSASLPLRCQRCLETVVVEVDQALSLAVTAEGEEQLAPERMEAWPLTAGPVRLGELLEDELLLATPLVPMHTDLADCGELRGTLDALQRSDEPAVAESPFAALKNLKR